MKLYMVTMGVDEHMEQVVGLMTKAQLQHFVDNVHSDDEGDCGLCCVYSYGPTPEASHCWYGPNKYSTLYEVFGSAFTDPRWREWDMIRTALMPFGPMPMLPTEYRIWNK